MEHMVIILRFVAESTLHILPYFVASILVASAINTSNIAKERIRLFTKSHPLKMIVVASLLGTLSPFCSCGVIPVISGFLMAGAQISPVLAFWISSPLMDPNTFFITLGGLGPEMALFRLGSAFFMGLFAGVVGLFFERGKHLKPDVLNPQHETASCCSCPCSKPSKLKLFLNNSMSASVYLGKWLLLAFVLEAIIINYVPMDWIGHILGKDSPYSIPLASLIGLPMYINGIGAVPIVKGLMIKGMSNGAAMAFLISGPVSTIPAMLAVTAVARRKLFVAYLLIGLIGSLIAGYLCQLILG